MKIEINGKTTTDRTVDQEKVCSLKQSVQAKMDKHRGRLGASTQTWLNSVLAGQDIVDWAFTINHFTGGRGVADVAVKFDKGSEFIYIPIVL